MTLLTDNNLFQSSYDEIIKNFDNILYDDLFIDYLIGRNIILHLKNTSHKKIKFINDDNNILNSFENRLSKLFKNYPKLLTNSKRILQIYIENSREIYSLYNDGTFHEITYIIKKFMNNNAIVYFNDNNENLNKNKQNNLINYYKKKNNNSISFADYNDNIDLTKNVIIFDYKKIGIYKYYSEIELFVNLYNKIIKMEASNNYIAIKVKTDFYLELIFDIISMYNYYFENVYLFNSKYTNRYNFILILHNKINVYNANDKIDFNVNLYRLFDDPIDNNYIKFMDSLYEKTNNHIKIYMTLDNIKKKDINMYNVILNKINNLKTYINHDI